MPAKIAGSLLAVLLALVAAALLAGKRSTSGEGKPPATFWTTREAESYVRKLPIGGRLDEVRIGLRGYLVVLEHGSGVAVTSGTLYRRGIIGWERFRNLDIPARNEHLRAVADGHAVVLIGQRTGTRWTVFSR